MVPSPSRQNEPKRGPKEPFYRPVSVTLLDHKQWQYIKRRYSLSSRELEVARLVCQGLTNRGIANALGVKPGTVKTHLKSIFNKTRVRNKITMLLKFVEDVSQLSGRGQVGPIPIVEVEKRPEKPSPTEKKRTDRENHNG